MSIVSTPATTTTLVEQFVGPTATIANADGAVGFYGTTPVAKQTGVAVSAAGVHAALVALGLIAA